MGSAAPCWPPDLQLGPISLLRPHAVPAYIGDDTLLRSIGRLLVARRTVARVYVESLQLPGADRRELARRCLAAIRTTTASHPGHQQRRRVLAS